MKRSSRRFLNPRVMIATAVLAGLVMIAATSLSTALRCVLVAAIYLCTSGKPPVMFDHTTLQFAAKTG